MNWVNAELALTTLAAMLSPTTLSFSVLALVLGDRPLRTGLLFYGGALGATLIVGVIAGLVIGDSAASSTPSSPKTWVAVVDIIAGALIVVVALRILRRPPDPARAAGMIDRMSRLASSPAIAIAGAGATLANPGGFIPLALKEISERDPSPAEYVVQWIAFAVISLLPLLIALIALVVRRDATMQVLNRTRTWLEHNGRRVAVGLLFLLAFVLFRNGIAGLAAS